MNKEKEWNDFFGIVSSAWANKIEQDLIDSLTSAASTDKDERIYEAHQQSVAFKKQINARPRRKR